MGCENAAVRYRSFPGSGGNSEYFISVSPECGGGPAAQAASVASGYAGALAELGLRPGSAVFRRVFLSRGPGSHESPLKKVLRPLRAEGPVALSCVLQPPLPHGGVSLLAYHIQGRGVPDKRRLSSGHTEVAVGGLRHIWSTGLRAGAALPVSAQTEEIFENLSRTLLSRRGNLAGNCVRTWLYLRDIGRSYGGMVSARAEIFSRHGLTRDTHYISSTGIEGSFAGKAGGVGLDAYSVIGLRPGQVSYLNDLSRLCRAADYNVTFERGTRVAYSDRAHYFVSGTASIGKAGEILYRGDALRQMKRTVSNMEALLRSGGGRLEDLMYLIVYLRNAADFGRVKTYLDGQFPGLPLAVVRGAVCRPGWLVEAEGVGISRSRSPGLPSF